MDGSAVEDGIRLGQRLVASVVAERAFAPGEIRTCKNCHGINTIDQAGNPPPANKPQALADLLAYWKTQNTPTSTVQNNGNTNYLAITFKRVLGQTNLTHRRTLQRPDQLGRRLQLLRLHQHACHDQHHRSQPHGQRHRNNSRARQHALHRAGHESFPPRARLLARAVSGAKLLTAVIAETLTAISSAQ